LLGGDSGFKIGSLAHFLLSQGRLLRLFLTWWEVWNFVHRHRSSQGVSGWTVLQKPAQDTPVKMTIRIFFSPLVTSCKQKPVLTVVPPAV
jgi:hypothetical protein